MTIKKPDYTPVVPFENGTCSYFSKGLKLFPVIMAIFIAALIVYNALISSKSIPFDSSKFAWVPSLSIVVAVATTILGIGVVSIWKGAYNEVYPQGNWKDFLKRDWTDFLGDNHQHYTDWEKSQTEKSTS